MANISEQTLLTWIKPPSDTVETKLSNAERMVREAIQDDPVLRGKSIDIFGQGSYANDTNVRNDSDIDINVCFTGGFSYDLPDGVSKEDAGLGNPMDYSFVQFKNDVQKALVNKFGALEVIRKNKCLTIKGNSYRIETDVVPTFEHRRYSDSNNYVVGVELMSEKFKWIKNYPKQHISNGKQKNSRTSKRFKRLTRIHRKARYSMIDAGVNVNGNITSFLLECLAWNVSDSIFNEYSTWEDRLRESVVYLYDKTGEYQKCKDWGEVSELLYLFRDNRKWSYSDVNQYLLQLWQFLGF
jgi:hypothetical protein